MFDGPMVSCLCPTRGRFGILREALACFLQQDYRNKELIILNHHPVPLACESYPGVRVYNEPPEKHERLYLTRNRLFQLARGEMVRAWDDDDLYLPWCVSQGVEQLRLNEGRVAWKPKRSWYCEYNRTFCLDERNYEPSMTMWREAALRYPCMDEGDRDFSAMLSGFASRGGVARTEMGEMSGFICRWGNGVHHVSGKLGYSDHDSRFQEWRDNSNDVGEGGPLTPAGVGKYWRVLCERASGAVGEEGARRLTERLSPYML